MCISRRTIPPLIVPFALFVMFRTAHHCAPQEVMRV